MDLEEGSGTEDSDTELLEKAHFAEVPEDCIRYHVKCVQTWDLIIRSECTLMQFVLLEHAIK